MIHEKISEVVWKKKYRHGDESETDTYRRLSKGSSSAEATELELFDIYKNHMALPAGRITYGINTGKQNVTFSNCFALGFEKDELESVYNTLKNAGKTLQHGGGTGYNFSIFRPKGSVIRSTGEKANGVMGFIKIFDTSCSTLVAGGDRYGAQMAVLDVWHPDIEEFISYKCHNELRNFNMSVGMYDEFMEAVKNDRDWELIFPDITFEKYDSEWDGNIKKWVNNSYPVRVWKVVKARHLYNQIIKNNYDWAEPGMLFIDTINRFNNGHYCEWINTVNPCGELPLHQNSACLLGSINLVKFVKDPFKNPVFDFDKFNYTVEKMVVALNNVLDANSYPLHEQAEEARNKRLIGLGYTGLGSMFAMMKLRYASDASLDLLEKIHLQMTETAYLTSSHLASKYGSFSYFDADKYLKSEFALNLSEKVRSAIEKQGIRNLRILSIAPTGTMSLLLNNVSSGIEPIFSREMVRNIRVDGNETEEVTIMDYAWKMYNDMGLYNNDTGVPSYFATSQELTVEDHMKVQMLAQKYIDSSISKTINVPQEYDYDDFSNIYTKAWEGGLKGCTTYRQGCKLGSVLSSTPSKNVKERELPDIETSVRHKVVWKNNAKVYIIVTIDSDGNPLEVFSKVPKEVGVNGNGEFNSATYLEKVSYWESICRLISLALRCGVPIELIQEQLDKSSYTMFDLSALINRVLNKSIQGTTKQLMKCPNCGEMSVIKESGCAKCQNCEWTKCD